MKRLRSNGGYSLIEIMVVMAVLGVLGAMAVPMVESTTSGIKLREEANAIADLVGLAKMRATSQFARARVRVNVDAGTYVLQVRDSDTGVWVNEQAEVDLPFGVSFGWGDLEVAPPNTQMDDEIKFAPECLDEDLEPIDNTACIMFNSRGIPIDKENSPTGGNAFYLTDGTGVRAVTVTATPLVRRWWSSAGNANWVRQ
jgi:prepilin-type N-terminal cleavage/methylation domain-containing protein